MNYGFKRFVPMEINLNGVASHTDVHWGWPRCVLDPLLCLDFYCVHYEYYWPLKHVFCRLFCIFMSKGVPWDFGLPFWVSGLNNLDNRCCNSALKSSPSVEVVHATCVLLHVLCGQMVGNWENQNGVETSAVPVANYHLSLFFQWSVSLL